MLQKNQLFHQWRNWLFVMVNCWIILNNTIVSKTYKKTLFNNNNLPEFASSTKLAFSSALPDTTLKVLNNNMPASQEIIIYGLDNHILKEKLLNILHLQHDHDKIISQQHINALVDKMKLSGFFTHIDISKQYIDNHQIVYVNVNVNPLLKSITIIDFKNKLIPSNYMIALFKQNIGYPINFIEINKNIGLIQDWYHVRGYKWTNVHISSVNQIDGNIIINISEGVIAKVEINHDNNSWDLINSLPASLFLETLKIKPNSVLNIKRLEKGIVILRQKKVIADCSYDISSDYSDRLNIYLSIRRLDDRYTYLFGKHVLITSSLLESLDLLLQSSFHHFFENNHYQGLPRANSLHRLLPIYDNSLVNSIYFDLFDYDNYLLRLLNLTKYRMLSYFNEWYLAQLILTVSNNFGFRHYIRNTSQFHSNYIIEMKFPITGPYLNLKYYQPWISIYNQILSSINFRYYKSSRTFQQHSMPILLHQFHDHIIYDKHSILSETGISLTLKHSLNTLTQLSESLSFKKIVTQHLILHTSSIWYNLPANFQLSSINAFYSSFKQVLLSNIQEFFQLEIKFLSSQLHNFFRNYETRLEINHFIPKKITQKFYRLPIILRCGNKIRARVNAQYNIMNNYLIFESELLAFIGKLECLPYSEHFFVMGPNIVRGYKEKVFPYPLRLGKIKLEYHLQFTKYYSSFIFFDCAKSIKIDNEFKDYQIIFSQDYLNTLNSCYLRAGYGLGIQIKTLFKQIPPLRIEYGYNIHNGSSLHLRLDKQ